MGDQSKTTLRIDWFDGTLIEDIRPSTSSTASTFADEDLPESPSPKLQPQRTENKLIGFNKLLDISILNPPVLTLQLTNKNSFWSLLNTELKGDFIVLIVRILVKLYKSLEADEKSLILTLLKTNFDKSNFLNTLKRYLEGLPSVRVVEKRMNSLLWNDVESFYFEVLSLCDGIIKFGNKNEDYLNEMGDLLEIVEVSALGVKAEHTERFSNNLFVQIDQLKCKVSNLINKNTSEPLLTKDTEIYTQDPNHYKNLSIFPTKEDILSSNKFKIQPNIINGAYENVEQYLDLQFKLLREDYFGPLREGICKYIENPSKRRHENIRVHPKVRIIRTYISNNNVGHLVDVAWKDRLTNGLIDSKKYAYNKQLMFGSLLLFTSDNFETILCATVLDSNLTLLSDGYIVVSFENPVSHNIFSEPYLMVESEVFFEPYHRVLKVLQNSKLDLPMRKYIVDVQTDTQPPGYLTQKTLYTTFEPKTSKEITFPVLDVTHWASADTFGLDNPQMEAFKHALTKEFSVIQGPPGTGKTFLGVKIASILLKNLSLEGTPMLIICYTNHALDQFLEGILDVTTNVVRLGSQSKSKILEPYTLNNVRARVKSKYFYLYANKRNELEKLFKRMTELQSEIEKCEKEIVCYKNLKPYLKIGDRNYELNTSKEDPVLTWLFGHLENDEELPKSSGSKDKETDELNGVTEKIETCFSEKSALAEITAMVNNMKFVKDVKSDNLGGEKMINKFKERMNVVTRRLECFKKYFDLAQNQNKADVEPLQIQDPYSLTSDQKWRFYFATVQSMKNELTAKMNCLLAEHNACKSELQEISTLVDSEALKSARTVAVTTTVAARRHDLMKKLLSPIVIVEEAAEVLEAHIVASLTHHCQHLVLIGDHKQLRPNTAHYKIAKDYNLEISLFERMIRNGIHCRTLTTQRRMRPNFVQLLVPTIYPKLDSHPNVHNYEDVRGMNDSLYFYTHNVFEDSEGLEDSWSHKNTFEAKFCVALANYLRHMEYSADEITILTTYTGQVSLIKKLSKNYHLLRDVKVTVVDNYQGEENRIVILSLVRSNRDGNIGFLKAQNRICVALSRAKEGFYIFGNMDVLMSASGIWKSVNDILVSQNAIGSKLVLRCVKHNENFLEIQNVEDFNNCISWPCLKICEKK